MKKYYNIIKNYLALLSLTFFLIGFTFSNSVPAEKEVIQAYNMYNLERIIVIEQMVQNTQVKTGFMKSQKAPTYFGVF